MACWMPCHVFSFPQLNFKMSTMLLGLCACTARDQACLVMCSPLAHAALVLLVGLDVTPLDADKD
jgi:hypothetical protein